MTTQITIDFLVEHKTLLQQNALKIINPTSCSNSEKLQLEMISLMSYMIDYMKTTAQTKEIQQQSSIKHESSSVLNFTFPEMESKEFKAPVSSPQTISMGEMLKQIEESRREEMERLRMQQSPEEEKVVHKKKKEYPKESIVVNDQIGELTPYYNHLKEWCGKKQSRIVFEGNNLDPKEYWRLTNELDNLVIVVQTTDDYLFGSYHSVLPSIQEKWVEVDKEHFVFTLTNPHQIVPTRFTPKRNNVQLYYVHNDNEKENIVWINYCYWISTDNIVYAWHHFPDYYNDTCGLGGNLFGGDVDWDYPYEIKKIYLLEWIDE